MTIVDREVVQLENGARVVLDPMPASASAAVGVWIGAGSRNETDDKEGLAHFLEHMVFKGAAGLDARRLVERVEDRGGELNASTGYERTAYHIKCLADDAPTMLSYAMDLPLLADLPDAELEREKNVVSQEIAEAKDEADDHIFDLIQKASWHGNPLGRTILGYDQTLEAMTREDLSGFIDSNYRADNVIVSVAGAYDRDAVLDLATARLGHLAPGESSQQAIPKFNPGFEKDVRSIAQTHFVLSRQAPCGRSPDRFTARILSEIMGGGMSSRLYQEVREKRGLVYAIDAFTEQFSDAGRLDVYSACAPEDVDEVTRVIDGVWTELAQNGPTDAELSRAKAVLKAGIAFSLDKALRRAGYGAYELLVFGELFSTNSALLQIDAVTRDDVVQVARKSVTGPLAAAAIGPAQGVASVERRIA